MKITQIKSSPLFQILIGKNYSHCKPFFLILIFNGISAMLEGLSYAFLLVALGKIGGETVFPFPWLNKIPLKGNFIFFIIAAVIVQIFRSCFTYLGQLLITRLSTRIHHDIQSKVFEQILNFTFPFVSCYKVGDLTEYATASATSISYIMDNVNRAIVMGMTIVASIFFLLMLSPSLMVISFLLFGLLALSQKLLIRKITEASKKLSEHIVEFSKDAVQNFQAMRLIHTFNRQKNALDKIAKTLKLMSCANKKLNLWNNIIIPFNEIMGIAFIGIIVAMGPFLFKQESPSTIFSILIVFIAVSYRLSSRIQIMMSSFGTVAFYMGTISRLHEILKKEDKEFTSSSGKPILDFKSHIELKNIWLQYPSTEDVALKDVTLQIPKGLTIGIVGPSGAGKSSLIDLLLGLYSPTLGSVRVDGVDLKEIEMGSWRQFLGVVSQDVFIFNDSIEENIRFGKEDATFEEVVLAASMAGADRFIEKLPSKYQTVVGERGYRLSGGERQRLALARALVRKPKLLILDEATSNLDTLSEQLIQEALEQIRHTTTVMIIAHRLSTVMSADHIVVLEEGRITQQGTHDELITKEGRYAELFSIK